LQVDEVAEAAALKRMQRVYGLDPEDFETQLVAISQSPQAALRVREAIATRYQVRHPTLLSYELLAHLLKHRYIDAIVSFNFDELLDQSLEDELGADEYRTIVSERDCVDVESDADAHHYVPLYIKLHGTASEPESLRFTRESYYAIPQRLITVLEGLLRVHDCVLANVGFGMASFDFQSLLKLPEHLEIYNLSKKELTETAVTQISSERKVADKAEAEIAPEGDTDRSCDDLLRELATRMDREPRKTALGKVHFRSVDRHDAIAQLLGHRSAVGKRLSEDCPPELARKNYAAYLRNRTLLELAFAAVKARGLLSINPLAVDRGGRYYDRYKAFVPGRSGELWRELCGIVGLVETRGFPDILIAVDELLKSGNRPGDHDETARLQLREFDTDALADRLLLHIANPPNDNKGSDKKALRTALANLSAGTEIELQSRGDRVCPKTFVDPLTLKTRTALQAYTRFMLTELESGATVEVISETGEWLVLGDTPDLLRDVRIKLIVAFATQRTELRREYKRRLELHPLPDPWRHNRHMTLVTDKAGRQRAIYFARRQRTPYVTAVYLKNGTDVERLRTGFNVIWDEAKREEEQRKLAAQEARKRAQEARNRARKQAAGSRTRKAA
jgi:hypothetical protein